MNDHFIGVSRFDLPVDSEPWTNLNFHRSFSFSCELSVVLHKIRSKSLGDDEIPILFIKLVFPNANGSRMTSLVALHVSKAFNNVNHRGLIIKLSWGFSKSVYSHLTGRSQFVDINGVYSTICRVYLLEPLLCILYVNDLPSLMRSNFCELYLFADDIYLLFSWESCDWKVLQ
uniref:Reverse transcriptase domain-containing protein n=1 Tax=Glossina palpalis gambiensis TaxID=67801 RepID=A0A1B0BFE2_9MUSC